MGGGPDQPAPWAHDRSVHRPAPGLASVVVGVGAVRAGLATTVEDLRITRPMLVCGAQLARSPVLDTVLDALGRDALGRDVVVYDGSAPHTPAHTVDVGADLARQHGIDGLIALGGSSAIDCAKGIGTLVATGAGRVADLAPAEFGRLGHSGRAAVAAPMALVTITTTLSFAEFLPFWGARHEDAGRKVPYLDGGSLQRTVILDGEMAASTPDPVWLATGVKALDDAIFSFCRSAGPEPFLDPILVAAVRELVTWLPRSRGPGRVEARHRLLVATWMTKSTLPRLGAGARTGWFSTAARHALGGVYGLAHGLGSCVALGPGLALHGAETGDRQAVLAAALGWALPPDGGAPLGPGVAALLEELDLPTRLQAPGIHAQPLDLDRLDLVVDAILAESPGLGSRAAIRLACDTMR